MATRIVVMEESPEDWLFNAPDSVLACRGQGHAWPKLRAGRLPKGARATRMHNGSWELITICRDCGMERRLVTLPTGDIDYPAKYSYKQPEGYKTPKGSEITRRQCFGEEWRRMREDMQSEIEKQSQEESA
jgi:hypothetical protein